MVRLLVVMSAGAPGSEGQTRDTKELGCGYSAMILLHTVIGIQVNQKRFLLVSQCHKYSQVQISREIKFTGCK